MTILLTGGTGKTAQALIPYLNSSNTPYLLTSRSPPASSELPYVQFDFSDATTYTNPFEAASSPISAVYLILPMQTPDPVKITNNFIDYAVSKHGVKRFVLLAATNTEKGGLMHGGVWEYLSDLKVEFTVLKCTWFLENLTSWVHSKSLKEEGKIYSAAEDGRAPWVAVDDISRVAYHALTSAKPLPESLTILGAKLYILDDIAAALSRVLSRDIQHVRLSPEDRVKWIVANLGFPEPGAQILTGLEIRARDGYEAVENNTVERVTGRKPIELEDWARENKSVWA